MTIKRPAAKSHSGLSFARRRGTYDWGSDFWLPQDVIDEMWLWHVNDARPEGE